MLKKRKKAFDIISSVVVLCFLLGSLGLGIISYIAGDVALGHSSLGVFVVFTLLYWFYGRDYLKVFGFYPKAENSNEEFPNSKALRILHILVILQFLVGPLLWAGLSYWVGDYFWGHLSVGYSSLCAIIYWFYGIDYFEGDWVYKSETNQQ